MRESVSHWPTFQWPGSFHWPSSLRARLFLILFAGLAVAYGLSFSILFAERYMSAKAVMLGTLESDLATSIAVIDRLPANERADWLDRLSRGNYQLVLGPGLPGVPDMSGRGAEIAERIEEAAGNRFPLRVEAIPGDGKRLQAHLTLSDGSPLTIDVTPRGVMPLAEWLPYVFAAQMLLLVLCTWLAVRQAVRPLGTLAAAADALDPKRKSSPLSETGPSEVADAARAFNAMRERIAHYLEERVQILAAISHDLQTPITRMRLRADMAEDTPEKTKLIGDLREIERLVQDGIAYARSSHGSGEKAARIDLASFIDSIAYDYQDMGKAVAVAGLVHGTALTRPHALRRILTNFIDNALKFAGAAEISVERRGAGSIAILVLDRGPGIPDDKLDAAMQPFFRLESSRNRDTGGTGLGLAIAQQLAAVIGGEARIYNRPGGGLVAEISLP
ncbi:HAMP domain-containing sensor histidine kinase [Phyllobacterium sp. 0TCS1.6C]|uniref:sensor histidine kinase n=1 Tax=unclassified Phyllobacterium TaxID=2638441 RepID=UPI0022647ED8|nr:MULTISPECIES: HAMP domain-containing sensor histidine kinase [unclassified Phyllobacterium]MCX8280154.1 HAMP domain-containing sensor histidine kinase [Phyllobacterium sp. 0TCS1.6C]MCX8294284.1 HAMP domain-containing sensor histidine kinase [Phyllobacterium sp. 0TCS1.6A]